MALSAALIAGQRAYAQSNVGNPPAGPHVNTVSSESQKPHSGVHHPGAHVQSLHVGAHPDDTLTYTVEPDVKKLLTDFVEVDEDDCEEITPGSWQVDTGPKHGEVSTGRVSGTLPNGDCPGIGFTAAAIYYTWTDTDTDETQDTFQATWSDDDGDTIPETFILKLEGCGSDEARGIDSDSACSLTLKRLSLMQVQATATATGGSFANKVKAETGTINVLVDFASGNTKTSNPNTAQLSDPKNPNKGPTAGGLAKVTATYAKSGLSLTDSYEVPTFGMSCYYTTLQSDWGTAPDGCKSVTIYGTRYTGTVKNPPGLTGTYCSAFIAEVKLQGSGVLDSGQDIQWIGGTFKKVSAIHGADGTDVVADKTLARDKSIIPDTGVRLDVDNIGNSLLANDTGGAIIDYRLDYYKGHGVSVCSGFSNIMSVSACSPKQTACPESAVK